MIGPFTGEYRFLSNFYPVVIEHKGITYPSVEHAYQASKTLEINERHNISRIPTDDPGKAKRYGRLLLPRNDWESIKLKVMLELLRLKFSQRPFKTLLLETGDEELIEVNYWKDTYWGVYKGKGSNHLGRLLMQIRKELQ